MHAVKYKLVRLLAALSISIVGNARAQNAPPHEATIGGHRLTELIDSVTIWGDNDTNYSQDSWRKLFSVAAKMQTNSSESVEKAIREYQLLDVRNGRFDDPYAAGIHNDRKLFLVMRVVFDLPEAAPKKERFIKGWETMRTEVNRDGTLNLAWPLKWHQGQPELVSGFTFYEGVRYNAADEFHYLCARFRKRALIVAK